MLTKVRTLRTIDESGAVLIVRLPDAESAERVAPAAIEGGFRAIEVTLSAPGAVGLIGRLAAEYGSKGDAVGAGTVLDGHAAYQCISAGASFLVSPQHHPEMIRVANRNQVATISGTFTSTELPESAGAGADVLKLFPTEGGPTATSPESSLLPETSAQPFRVHASDATSSPLRYRRGRNPVRSPGRACDTAATPAVETRPQQRSVESAHATSPGWNAETPVLLTGRASVGRGVNELTAS
jgi:2-keto-3-deoxy-6-phosphogluconate aldolase